MNNGELVKNRHCREGWNSEALNFLRRMDPRLRTSGMTVLQRTFCAVVNNRLQRELRYLRTWEKESMAKMKVLPPQVFIAHPKPLYIKQISKEIEEISGKVKIDIRILKSGDVYEL